MEQRVRIDRERLQAAAAVVEEAVQAGHQPCGLIAVANRAETVWTHVVSGADTVALDTIFLLASISKPITACAIMQLVEQGKLLLHKPVAAYLPEFGKNGKEGITPFHLLTHTNGLDETRWAQSRVSPQADLTSCFEEACNTSLLFEPGTRSQYGTLSFSVLGELITRLSGTPYPDYLRDHVFAPLGMNDTSFQPAATARRAPVHNFGEAAQLQTFMERAIPGGGLWSTASDLIALGQTLLNGGRCGEYTLLSPAAIATMTGLQNSSTVQWVEGQPVPFYYGLGWGKGGHGAGSLGSPDAYDHGGATGTLLVVDPKWDLIFVYLTNTWGDDHEIAQRTLNATYGALTLENPA